MAKNERKHGHSARNGNRPSPYTKYGKVPHKYDMDTINRNHERARACGMNYVDFMSSRQANETKLKRAA